MIYTSFGKKKIKISQNKLRMICWAFLLYLFFQWIVFQFAAFYIIGDAYRDNLSQIMPMLIVYAGLVLSILSIGLVFNLSKQIDLTKRKNFQLLLSRIALSAIPMCISALFLIFFFMIKL